MTQQLSRASNTATVDKGERSRRLWRLLRWEGMGLLLALLILVIIMSFSSPYFLTTANILNILLQMSPIGITAVGMTLVIVAAEIDLSVGGTMGIVAMVAARLMTFAGINPWISVLLALLIGAAIGVVNGFIIVKLGINSFVTTLGMMSVTEGLTLQLSDNGDNVQLANSVSFLGNGYIGNLPFPVIEFILIVIMGAIFLTKTLWGKEAIAVGGNAKAARLSGVNVQRVRMTVFIISGVLAGFAGLIQGGIVHSAAPNLGNGAELNVIAAAVIGGASLMGGKGSVVGALLGSVLIGVINNAFVMLSLSQSYQIISLGVVIILALLLDRLRYGRKKST